MDGVSEERRRGRAIPGWLPHAHPTNLPLNLLQPNAGGNVCILERAQTCLNSLVKSDSTLGIFISGSHHSLHTWPCYDSGSELQAENYCWLVPGVLQSTRGHVAHATCRRVRPKESPTYDLVQTGTVAGSMCSATLVCLKPAFRAMTRQLYTGIPGGHVTGPQAVQVPIKVEFQKQKNVGECPFL